MINHPDMLLLLMSLGPAFVGLAILISPPVETRCPALVLFIGLLLVLAPIPVGLVMWLS